MMKLKNYSISLRVSILLVVIIFFSLGMLLIIASSYYRLTNNLQYTSKQLIQEVSSSVYNEIVNSEMLSAELISESFSQLIKQEIFSIRNKEELQKYAYSILRSETQPIIQTISYGDRQGNVYDTEKQFDGGILTQIVLRHGNTATQHNTYRNSDGLITRTKSFKTNYDPRFRPWYKIAENKKNIVWNKVFTYVAESHGMLGTGISTPIYNKDNKLQGVIFVGIRLDYLAKLLEKINVSKNGVVYVVTDKGMLIGISKIRNRPDVTHHLLNIHQLKVPGLVNSFNHYLKTNEKEFIFKENNQYYVSIYRNLPSELPGKWMIGVLAPETDFVGSMKILNIITICAGFLILFIGIILVSKIITKIITPLNQIIDETEKIKNFHLDMDKPESSRISEINTIANSIYSMKLGLRSFQKYVPAGLVRQLIDQGEDAMIGGSKKQIAIAFSDIKDFTKISESEDPNQLMVQLNQYFDSLSKIIDERSGTVDKFIGDSIMAFWGAPSLVELPCDHAAESALACIKQSNEMNEQWKKEGKPIFFTRIGINFGDAIVGNMGSSEHLNYTAIGDSINMASRLQSVNKVYGSQIIVSQLVYEIIKNKFSLRLLDFILLKGKHKPIHIYELLSDDKLTFDLENYNRVFLEGFHEYQQKKWRSAISLFKKCLVIYPNDSIALLYISRCDNFLFNPPSQKWDGIWEIN